NGAPDPRTLGEPSTGSVRRTYPDGQGAGLGAQQEVRPDIRAAGPRAEPILSGIEIQERVVAASQLVLVRGTVQWLRGVGSQRETWSATASVGPRIDCQPRRAISVNRQRPQIAAMPGLLRSRVRHRQRIQRRVESADSRRLPTIRVRLARPGA